MANKTITMLQIRKVLQLLDRGYSQRRIARDVGISRNTVQEYHSRITAATMSFKALLECDDQRLGELLLSPSTVEARDPRYERLAPLLAGLIKDLSRTGVTRQLLWQEYCAKEADPYSYQQFCFHFSNHTRIHSAVMHLEHQPGNKAEIDFAGDKLSYVDRNTGEVIECPVLVGVLPFSGYAFMEPLPNMRMEQLVEGLNACMLFFEGVPTHVVSDNMAQVVKKANRYEPSFTALMNQWSVHYNVALLATRVAKPRDKSTVEKAVDLVYKRVYAPLRDKVFFSLEELRQATRERLKEHNHALFQKKNHSRYDMYLQEKEKLEPLPSTPFEIKYSVDAKVQKNYHITLGQDWHHYSVPFRFIGKKVKVVYDSQVVEIFDGLSRIAFHTRDYRNHVHSTSDIHMPEKHLRYKETLGWDQQYFLDRAAEIGEDFTKVIEHILKSRQFTQQTFNSCKGLLRLKDHYGKSRLEAASKRALVGSSITYTCIQNILSNGTDQQMKIDTKNNPLPTHDNIRGSGHYQ